MQESLKIKENLQSAGLIQCSSMLLECTQKKLFFKQLIIDCPLSKKSIVFCSQDHFPWPVPEFSTQQRKIRWSKGNSDSELLHIRMEHGTYLLDDSHQPVEPVNCPALLLENNVHL